MDIILWIAQGLLAVAFLGAGMLKLTRSGDELQKQMPVIDDIGLGWMRIIGLLEVLGAVGLIVPLLLNIQPILTPLAAIGLGIVMVGAALTHVRRGEYPAIAPSAVLLSLTLFVAIGRLLLVPVPGV